MKVYTVQKGKHSFTPFELDLSFGSKFEYEFSFIYESIYDLKDNDQLDWNKLCGVTMSLIPNKQAAMIGWRYNVAEDLFEVLPYINEDGNNINLELLGTYKPIKVSKSQYCKASITFDKNVCTFKININGVDQPIYSYIFKKVPKLKRQINPWFGGNKSAPKQISIYLTKK